MTSRSPLVCLLISRIPFCILVGNNDFEISKSVNDILDLEADRAVDMIRHIAAIKPMNDLEIDALGVRVLDGLCADLDPAV